MTENRPILFSAPMVRAIREDRKTQTRRVIKPQPREYEGGTSFVRHERAWVAQSLEGDERWFNCPYGQPDDRLWVRETWSSDFKDHYPHDPVWYRADGERDVENHSEGGKDYAAIYSPESKMRVPFRWHPSIHMPRHFSRITLEITDIRVERVQDITPADCRAEGMPADNNDVGLRYCYGQLWNEINEKRGFGWETNPWVWVLTFKKLA